MFEFSITSLVTPVLFAILTFCFYFLASRISRKERSDVFQEIADIELLESLILVLNFLKNRNKKNYVEWIEDQVKIYYEAYKEFPEALDRIRKQTPLCKNDLQNL